MGNSAVGLVGGWLCLLGLATGLAEQAPQPLPATVAAPYELGFEVANPGPEPMHFSSPAGAVWRLESGGQVFALRKVEADLAGGQKASVSVPVAAMSSGQKWRVGERAQMSGAAGEKVDKLLLYLAARNDVPRSTSQLASLALLEDLDFAGWQKFEAANRTTDAPPLRNELAGALDAVSILRAIEPGKSFALNADAELKLRSLRDPGLRAKAMQLFGLSLLGDAPAGGVAPDLGQLLHTKPGDNCPICRMRQAQEAGANLP